MDDFLSLSSALQKEIEDRGSVDLLIGLPSYNCAPTIVQVLKATDSGLSRSFPQASSLILVVDGGSLDGTISALEALQELSTPLVLTPYPVNPSRKLALPYHGIPEREKALWTILHIAQRLQAKACAILDARNLGTTPGWIASLLAPILQQGFDYVSPVYARPRYEGNLVNSIVYPLIRAFYGKDLHHPLGGDFALSGRLAAHFLSQEVWNDQAAAAQIEMWMAISAILTGYPLCQAHLGPKRHEGPPEDLAAALSQVVGSLFYLVESHQGLWQKGLSGPHAPILGTPSPQPAGSPSPNPRPMIEAFQGGLRDLLPLWEQALSPETMEELYPLVGMGMADFRFPMDLWVRVIYDMLLAYHYRIFYWRHLLKSLTPLYLGRMASLIIETEKGSEAEAEQSVELLCQRFIALQPYLTERWR